MSITRYLLNFAYIGTGFRGSQRQVRGGSPRPDDPSTIQGVLEMGLKKLNPINDVGVTMASRTDAGVHALNTTCHFDLHRSCEAKPIKVISHLNKFFVRQNISVRILNAKIVPNDFHCRRKAISRTYLYRLIAGKYTEETPNILLHFFPIEELQRAFMFCYNDNFDIDRMRAAAKMFEGLHDFRTFMGQSDHSRNKTLTRREIFKIDIIERRKEDIGVAYPYSWPEVFPVNTASDSHLIIDIYFKGKGFLYKQVRRTVGTLLAAARGTISLRDIQFMLQVPSKHSWISVIRSAPGHGLYLCNIEYPPEN